MKYIKISSLQKLFNLVIAFTSPVFFNSFESVFALSDHYYRRNKLTKPPRRPHLDWSLLVKAYRVIVPRIEIILTHKLSIFSPIASF